MKESKSMKSYVFKVIIEADSFQEENQKVYHASCPALKGCHTWGHTYGEALANIKEAVELYIEDLRDAGEPIPVDPEQGVIEYPNPSVAINV